MREMLYVKIKVLAILTPPPQGGFMTCFLRAKKNTKEQSKRAKNIDLQMYLKWYDGEHF